MSQHDNSQQDKVFVRNFSVVLGVLILAAIGAYVLASGVTGGNKDVQQADAIKPIGQVQVAVAETKATVTPPAPTPAPADVTPAATPAEVVAKPTVATPPAPAETPAAPPQTEAPAPANPPASETPATAETPAAAGGSATTDQVTTLMAQKAYPCMACHQVETKLVGPGFKEVAAKYKGDAQAAVTLAGKIKAGGVGTWGQMPMPANPTVTDEDMKTIVDWILALQ